MTKLLEALIPKLTPEAAAAMALIELYHQHQVVDFYPPVMTSVVKMKETWEDVRARKNKEKEWSGWVIPKIGDKLILFKHPSKEECFENLEYLPKEGEAIIVKGLGLWLLKTTPPVVSDTWANMTEYSVIFDVANGSTFTQFHVPLRCFKPVPWNASQSK